MPSITAFEAKTRFGELLERVARGEEIVITRHDRPVARIVPMDARSQEQVRHAVAGLNALRDSIARRAGPDVALSDAEIREAIEEGRP